MLEGFHAQLFIGKEDKDDKNKLEDKDIAETYIKTESVARSARPDLVEGCWPVEGGLEDLPVTASCLPSVIAGPWRDLASGKAHFSFLTGRVSQDSQ